MKRISLSKGKFAIVDDIHYEELNRYNWFACKIHNTYYAKRNITKNGKKTTIFMHRQILNANQGQCTDHINHNGLDNRVCNIRPCNMSQNNANNRLAKKNKSGHKGIWWDKKRNKWQAAIGYKHKKIHLGRYENIVDAVNAYNKKAKEIYREFSDNVQTEK